MAWEISWADMCRACMEIDGDLLPLYDDEDDENNKNDLSSKLAELASIEINKSDGLPTKLCEKCFFKTNSFYEFKYLVQESNKKLKHMFDEMTDQLDNINDNDDTDDHIVEDFILPEVQSEDKNENKDKNDISYNLVDQNSIIYLQPPEEEIQNSADTEDVDKECKTVIIRVTGDLGDEGNSKVEDIHIVLKPEQLKAIKNFNESQFINNQSNTENQDQLTLSFEIEEEKVENKKSLGIDNEVKKTSLKTEKVTQDKELKRKQIVENSQNNNIPAHNDNSDSDSYTNEKQNIVGSINDTITKVKEIKKNGKTVYQCTLCLQDYTVLSDALCHLVDLHVPSTGPFYCIICEMDCDSIKHLKSHVRTHQGPTPYICFLCNKSYVMKRYLKRHMACHTDFPRHRCTKCGLRFKIKSELEAHIAIHSDNKAFKCSQCPRVFNHKGNYKRHLISHLDPQGLHLPKYPCTICNRRFLNNRTLVTHMRVHTGEKPFKCELCGKAFSQQGNLFNHQKIHTNPRSFTCEVCGKSFNQKATLKDHSMLHSGEKPYVCSTCGMAFTFSAALRRHMWSHSEGKPFECDLCDAKFVGRYDLKRHMRIHNDKSKLRRTKSKPKKNETIDEVPEETINIVEDSSNTDTIFVEQIFLCDDNSIQVIAQGDSEKENVDSLLSLI